MAHILTHPYAHLPGTLTSELWKRKAPNNVTRQWRGHLSISNFEFAAQCCSFASCSQRNALEAWRPELIVHFVKAKWEYLGRLAKNLSSGAVSPVETRTFLCEWGNKWFPIWRIRVHWSLMLTAKAPRLRRRWTWSVSSVTAHVYE